MVPQGYVVREIRQGGQDSDLFHWSSWFMKECCSVPGIILCMHHYSDFLMGAMASQLTSPTIVDLMVYWGADQIKYQSSASLAFVRGIHWWPVNSPHKWPVTRIMFHLITLSWCTQPMRDNVTLLRHLSLAGGIYKMIPAVVEQQTPFCLISIINIILDTGAVQGHYSDVMMSGTASQITSIAIVRSLVCSDAEQRNLKALLHWPLWEESTGNWWIPLTKG